MDPRTLGISVIVALELTVMLAWLVAVSVTICCTATVAGAVYKPVWSTVPIGELSDHVTAVLARNCCVCDADKLHARRTNGDVHRGQ